MARLGGAVPIGSTGFACSLAWRVEGVPRYDVFGESHGFRRPGVEMFLEPGASYARGSHVYAVQIPFGYYRNRFPNPYTGNKGDATFPKYIVLASYGYRFGGASKPDASLTASAARARAVNVGSGLKPFTLKTLDGAPKTLPNVLGKATLVVFFYPTCPFCNVAAPEIQRLYDTYKAQGLSVVYINTTPSEEKLVPGWLEEHHYTVPVLVGARPNDVQRDYAVEATPTHYLLDARGAGAFEAQRVSARGRRRTRAGDQERADDCGELTVAALVRTPHRCADSACRHSRQRDRFGAIGTSGEDASTRRQSRPPSRRKRSISQCARHSRTPR